MIELHRPYNDVEHYRPFSRYWSPIAALVTSGRSRPAR
jgi:hypothetical protein